MKKLFVVFIFLTLFIATALPALAGEATMAGWVQTFPPTSPPPRADIGLAYDTARGVAVLFGGYASGAVVFDDTWEWNSLTETWVERQPVHKPPARFGHAMVYDEARGVTVLFGGVNYLYQEYNDTWFWTGDDWEMVATADAPSPRWLHGMVYDSQRQVVVLFGGQPSDAWTSDETWEFVDGANWVLQNPVFRPAGRYGMGLAYDSRRGATVLFAGDDGAGWGDYFFDTWERQAGNWVERLPNRHPPDRQSFSMAYFPPVRRTVIYGGLTGQSQRLDDTWAWNGSQWTKANFPVHPSGGGGAMVYDPVANGLLLYVGVSLTGQYVGETWYLR